MAATVYGYCCQFDHACPSVAILLLAVLILRMESKNPVFVRYTRTGKEGALFSLLRFRDSPGLGFLYSRFHLDSAPELINVVRGEMSLVGPSPETPEASRDNSLLISLYNYRHNVRARDDGLGQIN